MILLGAPLLLASLAHASGSSKVQPVVLLEAPVGGSAASLPAAAAAGLAPAPGPSLSLPPAPALELPGAEAAPAALSPAPLPVPIRYGEAPEPFLARPAAAPPAPALGGAVGRELRRSAEDVGKLATGLESNRGAEELRLAADRLFQGSDQKPAGPGAGVSAGAAAEALWGVAAAHRAQDAAMMRRLELERALNRVAGSPGLPPKAAQAAQRVNPWTVTAHGLLEQARSLGDPELGRRFLLAAASRLGANLDRLARGHERRVLGNGGATEETDREIAAAAARAHDKLLEARERILKAARPFGGMAGTEAEELLLELRAAGLPPARVQELVGQALNAAPKAIRRTTLGFSGFLKTRLAALTAEAPVRTTRAMFPRGPRRPFRPDAAAVAFASRQAARYRTLGGHSL
ncbi:MAG: hypothetical protein HY554_03720, partial [Elusimicrobia bacterium]|nr:hypothetical protein [Elusimicrobiota bacterium]